MAGCEATHNAKGCPQPTLNLRTDAGSARTLDFGPWTLDLGPWGTLDFGLWGPWTLDFGLGAQRGRGRGIELRFYHRHGVLSGETVLASQMIHRGGVLDELIRPAEAHHRDMNSSIAVEFEHDAPIPAHEHMVLQGDDHFGDTAKLRGQVLVDRFGESRINDGAVEALGRELLGGFPGPQLHIP